LHYLIFHSIQKELINYCFLFLYCYWRIVSISCFLFNL